MRQLRHRLLQFRHDNSDSTSTQDRKAFVTTVILLATLTFFFLPHTVYFFISLNTNMSHEGMSAAASFVLVLYMTLLPYLKMISDPLVYGVRMCRRPSTGHAVISRVVYADAASTPAVLRGAAPSTSPVTRLSKLHLLLSSCTDSSPSRACSLPSAFVSVSLVVSLHSSTPVSLTSRYAHHQRKFSFFLYRMWCCTSAITFLV